MKGYLCVVVASGICFLALNATEHARELVEGE